MNKPAKPILTLKKVLEVEELGLSVNKSAIVLCVDNSTLDRFIKRHSIAWRGKMPCYKHGQVNPKSELQRIKKSGINRSTVIYRMNIKGMYLEQAITMGGSK